MDETVWHDGQVWFKTKSISFAAMGQDQFRKFFTDVLDAIVSEVIEGMDRDALLSEISAMLGEDIRGCDAKSVDKGRDKQSR